MGVEDKDMKTCLGVLNLTVSKSNIGHHDIKVVYDKIGPIIQDTYHKSTKIFLEDEVLLMLEKNVDM